MKFFIALIAVAAASGQVFEEDQEMWTVRMDNDKAHEIEQDDKEIGEHWEKFYNNHKNFRAELEDLAHDVKHDFEDIIHLLEEYKEFLDQPKYKKEIDAIKAREMKLM